MPRPWYCTVMARPQSPWRGSARFLLSHGCVPADVAHVADINPSTLSRWALETRAGDPLAPADAMCGVCGVHATAEGPGNVSACAVCIPYLASVARAQSLLAEGLKNSAASHEFRTRTNAAIAECGLILDAFRMRSSPAQPELPPAYHPAAATPDTFLADLDREERRERAAEREAIATPIVDGRTGVEMLSDLLNGALGGKPAKRRSGAKLPPPRVVGGPEHAPKTASKPAKKAASKPAKPAKKAAKKGRAA